MLRKLMLLAAMLAMVLVAAAPAFAQDAVIEGDEYEYSNDVAIDDSFNTVAECIQAVDQYADADQDNDTVVSGNVAGDDVNTATANNQEISQEAVQYCNDYVLGEVVEGEVVVEEEAAAASSSSAAASSESSSSESSSSSSELPATGGISLLTLGAGALLVGGGLVARKLVK